MPDSSGGADAPLVSVVVPTYGRDPEHFREAVASVAAQTYGPVELIVVDDSPSDVSGTVDGDRFARVERVRGVDHEGAGDARNTGIWRASGEYIGFIDDDDRWHPEKLARQVEVINEEDVGVVYTALEYVRDGEVVRSGSAPATGDLTRHLLEGGSLGTFSTLLVRSALVPRAGFIDSALPVLEDREWCLRLSLHARFGAVDEPLVQYRQGDHDQLTDDFGALRDVAVPRFRRKHRELAASFGPDCEAAFLATGQETCAVAALSAGRFGAARRHALQALRHRPADRRAWAYLAAALGGEYTYRPLRALRRRGHRLRTAVGV